MRVCPNCGAEYRAEFTRCSDCDVALVEDGRRGGRDVSDSSRPPTSLIFPMLWTAATIFAFRLGSGYGLTASLGGEAVILYVMAYIAVFCGLLQSPFIYWVTRQSGASIGACTFRGVAWIVVTPLIWIIAMTIGLGTAGAIRGIGGVVITAVLIGTLVSLLQWPILHRALGSLAKWWVPLHTVALLIAVAASALLNAAYPIPSDSPETGILSGVRAIGPVFGGATGLSLWWLLRTGN